MGKDISSGMKGCMEDYIEVGMEVRSHEEFKRKLSSILLLAAQLGFLTAGCGFLPESKSKESASSEEEESVQTTEDAEGGASAAVTASSKTTQVIKTSSTGALAGSSLSLPPGALAVDVTISIQEASSLANSTTDEVLGVGNPMTAAGPAIVFSPSTATESLVPMTLSIPLSSTGLWLDTSDNLAVVFLATGVKDGIKQNYMGIIPPADLVVAGKSVSFKTTKFGAFQVVKTTVRVEAAVEKTTSTVAALKPTASLPHMGMWKGSCRPDEHNDSQNGTASLTTTSKREEVIFSRDTFVLREAKFSDSACQSVTESFAVRGEYQLAGDSAAVSGAKNLNVLIRSTAMTIHRQDYVDHGNSNGICGLKDWVLNVEKDLTTATCKDSGEGPVIGETIYTLMYIEGDTIRFGDKDGKTAETRSTGIEPATKALTRVK